MSDRFFPSVLRVLTLVGMFFLATIKIYSQSSNPDNFSLVPDKTFSNRTTDGSNDGNPANKTWTFADFTTSWDSRYYKGDLLKPAYTEGYLAQYSSFDFKMNYRLLFPVGYNAPENAGYKWPMIIMMHGAGETGSGAATSRDYLNNDKNVINGGEAHLNAVYLANGKKAEDPTLLTKAFPGFVLFPQTPSDWVQSKTDLATGIVERVIANYNVDPDRIYIHGLSLGGAAVWDMVNTKPQLYTAALPMSAISTQGDAIFNGSISKAVPIPSWIFQGGLDTKPNPNNTNQIVAKLKAAGASVRYTIYPNIGHGTWGTAYSEPDFFSWMLSKNKSDITVLYQNPTICPTLTSGGGAQLAVGTGFLAYQWEKDGVIISGATSNTYTANTSGTYRARYSRISDSPSEAQWNKWSKPVVITEASPVSTSITATNSTHFPDININFPSFTTDNGSTKWYSVSLQGPVQTDTFYDWYNGTTLQTAETGNNIVRSINNYNIGNQNFSDIAGTYTLKTRSLSGCPSLISNSISITTGTPSTLTAPTNFQAQVNSSGSVQLFWTDNANNEKGYEIQRATAANGPYTFFKLVGEDIVSYNDTGLIPNTTYYYQIRAVNNTATSPYSTSDLVVGTSVDTTPPSAPQNLVKITNSINSVKLGWTAASDISGIKKYIITYGGTTVDTGSADTNYTITDLAANTNYIFSVKAVDNANLPSQPSNQLLTSTVFSGLTYEHSPDNVGDVTVHSPANSLYGVDWGYYEYAGNVTNFDITPRVQDNYFNFKFNGYLKVPTPANYNFRLSGNDAANLYLGSSTTYVNTTTAFTYPGVSSYWTALNTGLTDANVRSVNAGAANILYAATGSGVYKTTFNTTTAVWANWALSNNGLTNTDVRFLAVNGSTLFAATAGGVFLSSNAGVLWNAVNTGLTNLDVRHVLISGSNIYASTAGGVFLSTDNGTTWNAMNSGLTNTNVRYIAVNGTNAYAATAGGVFLSVSGGNWSAKNSGLSNTDVRCVNFTGSWVFAGTAAGLFASSDAGTTWTAINTGLSSTSILSMTPVANGATNLFVGTASGMHMYSYTTQNSWTARPIGVANTNITSVSINGGNMYAGTPAGVMRSINSGANWATINRILELNGTRDLCATSSIATVNNMNPANFYPISLIYFDLVDDECLTVEYKLSTDADLPANWHAIPDSWFKSGTITPPTAPLVPTNLAANSTGMTSIRLNWSHASTTDNFEIYRSTDNVTYAIVATLTEDNLSTHTYADSMLTPATLYYYKIKSITTAGGNSEYTTPVSATTDPDSEAPTVPQNVVVVTSTYTNAGLKWTASIDNVQVAGYKIFANGDLLGTSTVATYFTTALAPSTSYSFTVKAYDLNGNESAASSATIIATPGSATFYSKTSADLSLLSSWGNSEDGTGTAPTDFSFNGQQFIVKTNATLSNAWTIGGSTSHVVVSSDVTFTLANKLTGKINLTDRATVLVNYTATDFNYDFDAMAATSSVAFNTYSSVPIGKYGNVTLAGTGVKTIPSGLIEVQGGLTLAPGLELGGASGNGTTIKIKGNLTTDTTPSTVSPDNLVSLQFTESNSHDFNLTSSQNFYKLSANANSTVTIKNASGSSKTIKLGSLNGGGLELQPGSVLTLGNNDLSLIGASSINAANTTGQLSMTKADIQLVTSSSSPSNLYFVPGENIINNFTLQSTGGGLTTIHEPLEIYGGLKINGGVLDASGNVIIKSSADSTASIRQIENGSIIGNVTVERYMAPLGELFRYLSSPVAGITVANWQTYLPVTGTFTGTSTGLGTDPSMYTYTEPNYVAFPAGDNSQQLQQGRGYAVYIYNSALPILKSTGVPYQGSVSFTSLLTPDTDPDDPDDGWNLVGNPYASDIVWSNDAAAWTSSGIADVIAVSDNRSGELVYQYWDRSGSGALERGKIPAGQAFWVQSSTASPSLIVNESAKTTDAADDNTEFYRTSSARTTVNNAFSFELDNGVNKDVAYVKFTDNGLDSYVKQTDGAKKQNSIFNLSTYSTEGVALAINDLSNQFCEKTIPVNINDATAGSYHLRFNNTDQFVMSNLVLQDKYLGTEQAINTSNNDIAITIDSEAASSHNRFYLKLSRPDVLIDMTATPDKKNFCSSEQMVTVTINDSQSGVEYTAFLDNTLAAGVKQTGTGEAIQLQVPVSVLAVNQNTISIQASFPGCTAKQLDKLIIVNKTAIPELTGADTYYGCVGSTIDIKVNSSSSSIAYHWTDIKNDKVLSETSGTLAIAQLADVNYYAVTAIDANGCESVIKNILVRSDTLATPVVAIKEGVLNVSSKGDIQWLLDGEIIPDAIMENYTPSVSGDYAVKVSNKYCVKESEPVAYLVTGLNEPANGGFLLQLYPNPSAHGDVTVTGQSNSTSSLQIQFLDMTGRELINRNTSYEEYAKGVKVKGELSAGAYIVRVIQDGTIRFKKLLIL